MSLVWAVQDLHMGGQEAGMEPVSTVLYGKPRGRNREERGSQEEAGRVLAEQEIRHRMCSSKTRQRRAEW